MRTDSSAALCVVQALNMHDISNYVFRLILTRVNFAGDDQCFDNSWAGRLRTSLFCDLV